jgi:hypothetical protein
MTAKDSRDVVVALWIDDRSELCNGGRLIDGKL